MSPSRDSFPHVLFGAGTVDRLSAELDALGIGRVLLITTAGRAGGLDPLRRLLGDRVAAVCARAAMHVPKDRVAEALDAFDRASPDGLLCVGGGSAVGLAKAVALDRTTVIAAVPTTYAGSEMTSIYGITDGEAKRTGRDPRVRPRLVIYDAALTLSLSPHASAASGMNAIAHAVEAMYAPDANADATAAADEALRALSAALPAIVARPADLAARTIAQRGAHAAGIALELAAMGLHHKICHVLGGSFGLPHAETHAAVLPHVVAFNAPAAPEAMARIAAALGAGHAADGLATLNRTLKLTMSLGELGLRPEDVDRAAVLITAAPYRNPRPATEEEVRALLLRAL